MNLVEIAIHNRKMYKKKIIIAMWFSFLHSEVYLWGTRIGYVVQENYHSIARLNYDEKFLKSNIEIAPIMMPLAHRGVFLFQFINGFI